MSRPNKCCYRNKYSTSRSNIFHAGYRREEETGMCYTGRSVQYVLACACSQLDKKPEVGRYAINDMGSVYVHYNPKTGKNEQTPNKLKEGDTSDGTNGK